MLMDQIKTSLIAAMKEKNEVRRDILRLLLSDSDSLSIRQSKEITDELVVGCARKIIAGIDETLSLIGEKDKEKSERLKAEKTVLEEFLPKNWSKEEIEAFFLNDDSSLFEQIQNADNEGKAIGMAMKALKNASASVLGSEVKEVVKKIRESE